MGKMLRAVSADTMIVLVVAMSAGLLNAAAARDRLDPAALADEEAATVLWFQDDGDSFTSFPSQNFESSYDIYDSRAADDFVVPQGEVWSVRKVHVQGLYGDGPGEAASESVVFYRNAGGAPGKELANFPALAGVPDREYSPSFMITLPKPVKLEAGRYWLSVQANMDFATAGLWYWELRATRTGRPAMWQNPGDGYQTGCTTYRPESTCVDSELGPDHMFELLGHRKASASAEASPRTAIR